jgi:hypothetical protein
MYRARREVAATVKAPYTADADPDHPVRRSCTICGGRLDILWQRLGVTSHPGCTHTAKPSRPRRARHGMTGSPTWQSWKAMRARCTDRNHEAYPNYGARGVRVCEAWAHDFEAFLRDVGERPAGRTLDRLDVDGNYEPGNVKWSTPTEQANNRRERAR